MSAAENTNDLPEDVVKPEGQIPPSESTAEKPRGRGRPKGSGAKAAEGKPEIETILEGQAGWH